MIVRLDYCASQQFVEFHLQNTIGEELHGVQIGLGIYQFTRHPANCGEGLQEWIKECQSKSCHQGGEIVIKSPTIE